MGSLFGFNAIVLTNKGYRYIRDIKSGDYLIDHTGSLVKIRNVRHKTLTTESYCSINSRCAFRTLVAKTSKICTLPSQQEPNDFNIKSVVDLDSKELLIIPHPNIINRNFGEIDLSDSELWLLASFLIFGEAFDCETGLIMTTTERDRLLRAFGNHADVEKLIYGRYNLYKTHHFTVAPHHQVFELLTRFFGEYGTEPSIEFLCLNERCINKLIEYMLHHMKFHLNDTYKEFITNKCHVATIQLLLLKGQNSQLINISKSGFSQDEVARNGFLTGLDSLKELQQSIANSKNPQKVNTDDLRNKLHSMIANISTFPTTLCYEITINKHSPKTKRTKYTIMNDKVVVEFTKCEYYDNNNISDFYLLELDKPSLVFVDNLLFSV